MSGERKNKRLDALKTHIQNICTHILKGFWEFCQKTKEGKIKYKQTVECHVRKYCHKEKEVQQNTYTSREHKAYTYLRIYTLKYKNTCIVYYVAVFLGYQVKKRNYIKYL